jgi:CMP-N-acetylneuraminic acid synthetase
MGENCLGIVCSRGGSKRLKGKNRLTINGRSLALRAVEVLKQCVRDVVHLTDIEEFLNEKESMKRPEFLNDGHVPLQDVVLWYLKNYVDGKKDYKSVVLLMPTNPWITPHDVEKAIINYGMSKFSVLRSYNAQTSEENGLYIMDIDYVLSNDYSYDVHTGAIICPGVEIHTQKDYEIARSSLEENPSGLNSLETQTMMS